MQGINNYIPEKTMFIRYIVLQLFCIYNLLHVMLQLFCIYNLCYT